MKLLYYYQLLLCNTKCDKDVLRCDYIEAEPNAIESTSTDLVDSILSKINDKLEFKQIQFQEVPNQNKLRQKFLNEHPRSTEHISHYKTIIKNAKRTRMFNKGLC